MYRVLAALIWLVLAFGTLPASAQTKVGPQLIISTDVDTYQPGVAPLGGGVLLAFADTVSAYSASAVKSPVTFSTPYGLFPASLRELPDGTFIVVEEIYPNLFIQRYSANGPKIGNPVQVNP